MSVRTPRGNREISCLTDALAALATGITRTNVNWILDADISRFFDSISHSWLIKFLEHRIGDQRVIRLIRKWLKAGAIEDGVVHFWRRALRRRSQQDHTSWQ